MLIAAHGRNCDVLCDVTPECYTLQSSATPQRPIKVVSTRSVRHTCCSIFRRRSHLHDTKRTANPTQIYSLSLVDMLSASS